MNETNEKTKIKNKLIDAKRTREVKNKNQKSQEIFRTCEIGIKQQ